MTTIDQKIAYLRNDLERMKKKFPALVKSERMTEKIARYDITMTKDILDLLTNLRGMVKT